VSQAGYKSTARLLQLETPSCAWQGARSGGTEPGHISSSKILIIHNKNSIHIPVLAM
jgi:hypothetical protein